MGSLYGEELMKLTGNILNKTVPLSSSLRDFAGLFGFGLNWENIFLVAIYLI